MTTEAFLAAKPEARFATQSGPMLVTGGAINPLFIPGLERPQPAERRLRPDRHRPWTSSSPRAASTSTTSRRFFRDHARLPDALFLDGGSASALYAPELGRNDGPGHGGFGPIIGVVVKAPGT